MNSTGKYQTKRQMAVDQIRAAIQVGHYKPGQVVSQRQLGEDLNLSTTPIREAIIELSAMGIVNRYTHQSIEIPGVDLKLLRDTYDLRSNLEENAIKLAFPNITKDICFDLRKMNASLEREIGSDNLVAVNNTDHDFHSTIFCACRNDPLIATINFLKSAFPSYGLWHLPGRLSTSVAEHDHIITSLENGDLPACIQAHRIHLQSGFEAAARLTPPNS